MGDRVKQRYRKTTLTNKMNIIGRVLVNTDGRGSNTTPDASAEIVDNCRDLPVAQLQDLAEYADAPTR